VSTSTRWRRWRSAPVAFAAALLLALLVTGGQGWLYLDRRSPHPAVPAAVGQVVTLGGTEVEVRSFAVAPELPAAEAGDPPVRGPEGSVLVLVTWVHTVVDPSVDLPEHLCESTLVADDGTVWTYDSEVTYGIRRPEALVCSDSEDHPLRVGEPRRIGTSYVIPASYASSVHWRLSMDGDREVAEFRP
jgi:hypothetical protein